MLIRIKMNTTIFLEKVRIEIKKSLQMLHFERIDVSERIDFNKTSASEECVTICTS